MKQQDLAFTWLPLAPPSLTHHCRNQDCRLQGPRLLPHMSPATISLLTTTVKRRKKKVNAVTEECTGV